MIKLLRITYCIELLTAVCIAVIFETGLLPEGDWAADEVLNYWLSMAGVTLTIILLPLSLRLMKFEKVKQYVAESEMNYVRCSLVRIAMLGVPLLFNTLCYYFTGCETTYAYMALMAVVCFLFIWPSKDKMNYERENHYTQDEQ